MKTELKCIPCFIDDIIGAVDLIEESFDVKRNLIEQVVKFIGNGLDYSKTPSFYITRCHRIIKKYYGKDNLFEEIREKCNQVGKELSNKVKSEVWGKKDNRKFKELIKWAIVGNELDFRTVGTGYNLTIEDFYEILYSTFKKPLDIDETEKIFTIVNSAENILYVLDNVGEIAFDKLLIEYFLEKGKKVKVAYRGGAITSDIILEDLKFVGITELPVETVKAGPDTLGISFEEMTEEMSTVIEKADLIIAKGQANYYEFSKHFHEIRGNIVNLLRTKCDLVSNKFNKKGKLSLAVVLREEFI